MPSAPTADLRSGHASGRPPVGTRLRQTSGRDAPTAFPTKGNCKEFACHSIRGRLYRSKPIALQKRERKKSTVPTRHPENSSEKHRRTQPWEFPGLGPCCLLGKKSSLLFSISQWLPCSASRDVQRLTRTRGVFRAYGGNHGGKPQLWRVPLRKGNPTEAISQSSRHNA